MNSRFPTERRASWRERFVAIARQAEVAPRPQEPAALVALRLRSRAASLKGAHRTRIAAFRTC